MLEPFRIFRRGGWKQNPPTVNGLINKSAKRKIDDKTIMENCKKKWRQVRWENIFRIFFTSFFYTVSFFDLFFSRIIIFRFSSTFFIFLKKISIFFHQLMTVVNINKP